MYVINSLAEYDSVIKTLPRNTPDTPYEVAYVNYSEDLNDLNKKIKDKEKFIDLYFSSDKSPVTVPYEGNYNNLFKNNAYLIRIDISPFKSETVTNADNMFYGCYNLLEVKNSGLRNVTSAKFIFFGCFKLLTVADIEGTSSSPRVSLRNCKDLTYGFAETAIDSNNLE